MRKFIFTIIVLFVCSERIFAAENLSFTELYHAAIKNNSLILNQNVSIEIAIEEKDKAYSTVRPQLNLVSSTVWREQANVGAFGEGRQHNAYASLSQPLFSGGAEYYALKIAKTFPEIAKLNKNFSEIQLYTQLSQLFYEGIRLQNEQKILVDQNKLLQERISTLQKRASIGRSKSTEVLAAKSIQAKVIAETSLNQKQMDFLKQKIKNLSLLESDYNFVEDQDPLGLTITPDWEKKLLTHPSVVIAELQIQNQKNQIQADGAGFLPKLDVEGKYYLDRAGILKDSDWDVTLNASWNLYGGGTTTSSKRISTLKLQQQEATLRETTTNLRNEFLTLLKNLDQQKQINKELKNAVEINKKNYEVHRSEFDKGLVNHLDLLRVLEEFLQAQKSYEQQIYATRTLWNEMNAMIGEMP